MTSGSSDQLSTCRQGKAIPLDPQPLNPKAPGPKLQTRNHLGQSTTTLPLTQATSSARREPTAPGLRPASDLSWSPEMPQPTHLGRAADLGCMYCCGSEADDANEEPTSQFQPAAARRRMGIGRLGRAFATGDRGAAIAWLFVAAHRTTNALIIFNHQPPTTCCNETAI